MKRQLKSIINVISCLLIILVMVGCSGETKPPFSSIQEIQQLLDNYPDIKKELVYLKVRNYEKGIITLDVIDADNDVAVILMQGNSLKELGSDPIAKVLRDIDTNLKQHQGVNDVLFTASCWKVYKKMNVKVKILTNGSNEEKEKIFRQIIQEYPDSLTKPYQLLAHLAAERKDTALQEVYFKKALEVNPNEAEIINELCWLYYTQDINLPWASETMVQTLKFVPYYAHGYNTYGAILLKMGDPGKATMYLEMAAKLRPKDEQESLASDYFLLAIAYARSGNMTAAEEAFGKAMKINPGDEFRKEAEKAVSQK